MMDFGRFRTALSRNVKGVQVKHKDYANRLEWIWEMQPLVEMSELGVRVFKFMIKICLFLSSRLKKS